MCASFWSSFLFLKPNYFLLHDGEFILIRRAHLLCILKRHHTYGVNTFVCSYSLNPDPSHTLLLSSLLDWQPYLLCGFPGFVTLLERRVRAPRKRFEPRTIFFQTLTQMRPRVPFNYWVPSRTKQIRRGSEALCLRTFSSSSFSTSSSSSSSFSSHIIHP